MKNKIKGETLIEGLLSMFFIANILVPVSNLMIKTYRLNAKVTNENKKINENKNMLELIKTIDSENMEKFTGLYNIHNITDFYTAFMIDSKYRVLKPEKYDEGKNILIEKTDNYYVDKAGNKEYIFKITVNNTSDFYFPKIE